MPRPQEKLALALTGLKALQDQGFHAICGTDLSRPDREALRLSAADYRAAQHIAPLRYAGGVRGSIDGHLASLGLERMHRVSLAYFSLVPQLLAETDLLFTTGRRFAESCARVAPLKIVKAPLDFPPMKFYQLWHARTHDAVAAKWLREQIGAVVKTKVA